MALIVQSLGLNLPPQLPPGSEDGLETRCGPPAGASGLEAVLADASQPPARTAPYQPP